MKKFMILAVVGSVAPFAMADVESSQFGGSYTIDYRTGQYVDFHARGGTTIYSNTAGAANFAVSSTDLTAVWGDEMTTTGTGTLDEFSFSIFNSGSGGGTFTSGQVAFNFYRASDGSSLGNFNLNLNSPLAGGFYSVFTVTGLSALGINLDTTGLIVTQSLSSVVGSTRMGIVSLQPVAVGSTGTSLYARASTIGGNVGGFYNFTSGGVVQNGAAGYQLVVPAPGALAMVGLGGLFAARRRRA